MRDYRILGRLEVIGDGGAVALDAEERLVLALLLLEPARRAGRSRDVAAFSFRLRRPAFAGIPVVVDTEPELTAGPMGGEPSVTGAITWR
jgi:hypothetical protein